MSDQNVPALPFDPSTFIPALVEALQDDGELDAQEARTLAADVLNDLLTAEQLDAFVKLPGALEAVDGPIFDAILRAIDWLLRSFQPDPAAQAARRTRRAQRRADRAEGYKPRLAEAARTLLAIPEVKQDPEAARAVLRLLRAGAKPKRAEG